MPLVAEHKTKVIGLCQSEHTIAETVEDKVRLANQLVERVTEAGISLDDLYIDPLIYPLATNPQSAVATIHAIKRIMTAFPGVHTTCGLTSVSYGLPNRKLVNRPFLLQPYPAVWTRPFYNPRTDKTVWGLEIGTNGCRKR